jgi:hypothetical protein
MFSKNARNVEKQQLMTVLGINVEARTEKYLGLPVYMGRSKEKTFTYLKDRVWKRLQGWKEKLLSKAGKEVLIKAVVQASLNTSAQKFWGAFSIPFRTAGMWEIK